MGSFAVDRELGNIKNSPHVFRATMVPKLAKSSPKGINFGGQDSAEDRQEGPEVGHSLIQDGAQDRQEEPQGSHVGWLFLRFHSHRCFH